MSSEGLHDCPVRNDEETRDSASPSGPLPSGGADAAHASPSLDRCIREGTAWLLGEPGTGGILGRETPVQFLHGGGVAPGDALSGPRPMLEA